MKKLQILTLLLTALLLSSCSGLKPQPDPTNPIKTVAVLPMYNVTNSVGGGQMVQSLVEEKMAKKFYIVKPHDEVKTILMDEMGVTMGSHVGLGEATPQNIGKTLGVDGVIVSYLIDFKSLITGVLNSNSVRAGFKLINVHTGKTVWSRGQGVRRGSGPVGDLGSLLSGAQALGGALGKGHEDIKGVAGIPGMNSWYEMQDTAGGFGALGNTALHLTGKFVNKVRGKDMYKESKMMVDLAFRGAPNGPGRGVEAGEVDEADKADNRK